MNQLGLFAKYWQPGKVKTRLAQAIGDENASRIYKLFLQHLIDRFAQNGLDPDTFDKSFQSHLIFSPVDARGHFEQLAGSSWKLLAQTDGDLGLRMAACFASLLECNPDRPASTNAMGNRAIIIGSDMPHLSLTRVENAFRLLESHDLVIGPSTDRGYYLIGMKENVADVFDTIPWSTSAVLPETFKHIERLGLTVALLPEMTDIDEIEDLRSFISKAYDADQLLDDDDQELIREILKVVGEQPRKRVF